MKSANGNGVFVSTPFDDGVCERYILGELSEPEQELFEHSYFHDEAFFHRFLALKDELLDLYSRGELDLDKRRRVERHFEATPPRRRHLSESDAFIRSVTAIAERNARAASPLDSRVERKRAKVFDSFSRLFTLPRLAAVAGLLVLITIGFWILNRSLAPDPIVEDHAPQMPSDTVPKPDVASGTGPSDTDSKIVEDQRKVPTQRDKPQAPETALNPEKPPEMSHPVPARSIDPTVATPAPVQTPEQRVAEIVKPPESKPEAQGARTETVTLSSTSRSVTGRNTASIGTATQSVVVRMLINGEAYDTYSVRVTTPGGATVWRASNVATGGSGRSLAVTIPAASLTRKDYLVIVEGRSRGGGSVTIREYYLHVDRK